jgi:hypothetical protein
MFSVYLIKIIQNRTIHVLRPFYKSHAVAKFIVWNFTLSDRDLDLPVFLACIDGFNVLLAYV